MKTERCVAVATSRVQRAVEVPQNECLSDWVTVPSRLSCLLCSRGAGEADLLPGNVPRRGHEAGQPGGGCGRGGRGLLPRVHQHAGGLPLLGGLCSLTSRQSTGRAHTDSSC